ncbi:metal ABC transporter solute-binding protein, Zn/Mn family [Pseudoroseomonas cervicalis]|uniref:metal ABC transporter solute-binding protein, Zn/Mn family n=1 Tax=Teichococcus cervicalis TaxID=204525 RepID=UPI00277F8B4B|nr:zinc ABC transporter substrate-binding protein [Pseudoroseomonas cervicalis]MDQ1081340.1 ABC-type Zn uptake system ZnuABC Zn-binding protein ZnuA [Pseudoroseomonas cervicalis]
MPLPRLLSRRPLLLGAAAAALLPWGLAAQPARGGGAAAGAGRLSVLATTAMVGDLARRIGGDRIALEVLMGEGVDPHLYKPTREDVAKLLRAGLVLYSGLLLEGKMTDAFTRIARTGRPVVAVAESLPREALLAAEGAEGHPDPHVWMDVSLWSQVATRIAQQLKETRPGRRRHL